MEKKIFFVNRTRIERSQQPAPLRLTGPGRRSS